MATNQTKSKTTDKDLMTKLADAGEEAVQKLVELPGGKSMVEAAHAFRTRMDEMTTRIRAIDPLEKRVTAIEKRLAALERKGKQPAKDASSKSAEHAADKASDS